jgi:hypothetical protein
MGIYRKSLRKERRMQDALIVIDRRKGKLVVFVQVALFLSLVAILWVVVSK